MTGVRSFLVRQGWRALRRSGVLLVPARPCFSPLGRAAGRVADGRARVVVPGDVRGGSCVVKPLQLGPSRATRKPDRGVKGRRSQLLSRSSGTRFAVAASARNASNS